jgi:hypothetical protein
MIRAKIQAKIVDVAFAMRALTVGIMLCVGLVMCGQNQPANMDKMPPQLDKKVQEGQRNCELGRSNKYAWGQT